MKSKGISLVLCMVMALSGFFTGGYVTADTAHASSGIVKTNKEMRGLWLAFCDFKNVGLYKKSEDQFRKNINKILKRAKKNKCNVVFFHVRAFDDAVWRTSSFNASEYIVGKSKAKKKASDAYKYDPLKIVCESADKYDLELHAWMNPYRITHSKYYNPKYKASRSRVLKVIRELSRYDIDGIHFDDYFYHSQGGYVKSRAGKAKRVSAKPKYKRKQVNKLVKAAYKLCHKKKLTFGISPQGNYDNDMADGADVKTWLSKTGYVDYLVPQIYWTDNWGSGGKTKMFTSRLNQFSKLNKQPDKIRMYIGLALYRCGYYQSDDRGWNKRNTNMKIQVKKIRKSKYRARGVNGFILFEAENLYQDRCAKELANLKTILQ